MFVYALKVIFISWVIGHATTLILKQLVTLDRWFQFNFVANENLNKRIGVRVCKWILTNSLIRILNPRLRMTRIRPSLADLSSLRDSMTYVESVHLIGFVFVILQVTYNIVQAETPTLLVTVFVLNIPANLYPVLVQQMNKRRLDCMINRLKMRPT